MAVVARWLGRVSGAPCYDRMRHDIPRAFRYDVPTSTSRFYGLPVSQRLFGYFSVPKYPGLPGTVRSNAPPPFGRFLSYFARDRPAFDRTPSPRSVEKHHTNPSMLTAHREISAAHNNVAAMTAASTTTVAVAGRRPTATAAAFEPLDSADACVALWNRLYPNANIKVKRGKWCDLDQIFDAVNDHRKGCGLTVEYDERIKNNGMALNASRHALQRSGRAPPAGGTPTNHRVFLNPQELRAAVESNFASFSGLSHHEVYNN